jgi:hypothetical protein
MAGLTDTEIKKAKATDKAYSMGDGGGLYLWVKPTGGKLWRWSYRFEGKEKLMSLGKYPDVSLAQNHRRTQQGLGDATLVAPVEQR